MKSLKISFFSSQATHGAIHEEVLAAMSRVYDSRWYILGEGLTQFEQEYSASSGVAHIVSVGNGLEALKLALCALHIGPGDEVLVPSNTYITMWLAVSHVGATPVPVKPEQATSNLDPARIEEALTPRTRAIIPVHLYRQPCRMPEIMALAEQHGLLVI